jgi:hypothetical protein
MTSSTSNTSRSSWLVIAILVLGTGLAFADHKRVVVLDFDGPKADKFHEDIVKALKKKDHTVVGTDKWNGAAEDLKATKLNKKNARKVAKKLKVDGIVSATIEKSDEGYVVHVKLRAGKSGAVVAEQIDLKSEGTKLSRKEVNDQLVGAIEGLEDNGGDGPEPADSGGDEGDDTSGGKHGGFTKTHDTGASATDDPPPKKPHDKDPDKKDPDKPRHKHVATEDDPSSSSDSVTAHADEPVAATGDEALTPANRAVDFGIGMSFTARHLAFSYASSVGAPPPAYKEGLPVAGGVMDATVYPFAITHKATGILTDLGIEVMYDKVIDISSKKGYVDAMTMTQQTASLNTAESHFAVGAVFRYPLSDSFVPGIKLMYENQQFLIDQTLPDGSATGVPDVQYSAVEPHAFLHYSATPGITINADAGVMFLVKTGDITADGTGYGGAKDYGLEFTGGLDYNLTKAIFVRALVHVEEYSLSFKGDANSLSDSMGMKVIDGAKDYYYGGSVQIGYAY